MKVNRRNLIELILQVAIIGLFFIEGFVTRVRCYSDGEFYSQESWFEIFDEVIGFLADDFTSVIFGVIAIPLAVCVVGVLVIQLVGQKRNLKIVPIAAVVETAILALAIIVYHYTLGVDYIIYDVLFCIIPTLSIALSAISVLGYIKAKKKGISDELLIKPKEIRARNIKAPSTQTNINYGEANIKSAESNIECGEGYRSLAVHTLLSIITFGVWNFIWVYKTTKFLNKTPNTEVYSPTKKLLLCIFVPMYQTYWFYKHGEKVDNFSQHKGLKNSYLTILCPLFPIFVISSVIMQDKINQICTHE